MLIPKRLVFSCKKILNYLFLHCTSLFMSWKSDARIFEILFQTGDINILILRIIFFSRYAQLKSSFSEQKIISGEIRDTI